MRVVKLCSNKILQGVPSNAGCLYNGCKMLVVVAVMSEATQYSPSVVNVHDLFDVGKQNVVT